MRTLATRCGSPSTPEPGFGIPSSSSFTPSGLIEPENAAGTLVSEAARGAGGRLLNNLGERS
jgi:hypothetical protein